MKTAPRIPPLLYGYTVGIWTLALIAVAVGLRAFPPGPELWSQGMAVALALIASIALAGAMPLMLSPTVKISVVTAPLFAAALLFPVLIAVCIGLIGTIAYHAYLQAQKRRTWQDLAFNAGRMTLQLALCGGVFHAFVPAQDWQFLVSSPALATAAFCSAILYYLVNVSTVYGAASILTNRSPQALWWSSVRVEAPQQAALLLFGMVTAVVVRQFPLLGLAMVFPVCVVYYSLRGSMSLRAHTAPAIEAIADAVDVRAFGAAGHSRRVAELAARLGVRLGMGADEVALIRQAARVHDIGKVSFADGVLRGQTIGQGGALTNLQMHPAYGAEILSSFPEYQRCRQLVRLHHERPDGAGYPEGRRADEIPLGAAIIRVAETFDALTTDRPYRQAIPQAQACAYLQSGADTGWNGAAVQALVDEVLDRGQERSAFAARAAARL